MRRSFILLLSVALITGPLVTGCSSIRSITKSKKSKKISANGLPAQTLAKGECGLFFWTIKSPHDFVFFQNKSKSKAQFYSAKTEKTLLAAREDYQWDDALDLDIPYMLKGVKSVRVKGKFSDDVEDGRRINQAAITITKLDGWQEYIPVSGVYACSNS